LNKTFKQELKVKLPKQNTGESGIQEHAVMLSEAEYISKLAGFKAQQL
jgi:hypothetical protein